MIILFVLTFLLAFLCFLVVKTKEFTEVGIVVKKFVLVVLMCVFCLSSVAFAEESEIDDSESSSPAEAEMSQPDEESALEDDLYVDDSFDSSESDSLSDNSDDSEDAGFDDNSGDSDSLSSSPPLLTSPSTPSPGLSISFHPKNAYGDIDDFVAFAVTPSGGVPPYSYRWQTKLPDDEVWIDIDDADDRVYTFKITEESETSCYRCFVSDSIDDLALSEQAMLYVGIPEVDENVYRYEMLNTVGQIYAFVIFFGVVVLCIFTYKFFRIFF